MFKRMPRRFKNNQFEYNNICYEDCPNNTYKIFQNRNICIVNVPENYYLDEDNINKECYNTCKKCSQSGNDTNNNCDECLNNYIFLNESSVPSKNCYRECIYFFYFNETDQYVCTESNICPSPYNKLIEEKKKCIDECKKDDEFSFNFNNICVKECPENTKIDIDEKKCLESCLPNQIELGNYCYNNLPNNFNQFSNNQNNILINNNDKFQEQLSNILQQAYSPENGNSITIQRDDDIIFQITDSKKELELLKNKSNNINNISIIDLGDCEIKLRETYHINENDSLIFVKNEKKSNKASGKKVDFDVYEPYNKTKLNLSICDGTSINIIIPVVLSEETKELYEKMKESGYDMFNINDPFYQDICTPFDSEDGTDMPLSDRINYIFNNDDTKCQSNCKLSVYSLESQYLNCSCSPNEDANDENNVIIEEFTAKKIYESFYEVLKYSNYDIFKCFNIINNKNIILKNIGSIIIIIYFCVYLICLIIFIIKGINPLKTRLKNNIEKSNEKNNLKLKNNFDFLFYPPQKNKSKSKNKSKNKSENKSKNEKNTVVIFANNSDTKKNNKKIKKRKIKTHIIKDKEKTNTKDKFLMLSSNNNLNISPSEQNTNLNLKKETLKIKTKIDNEEKKEYDDFELNELEYTEEIKYDKRSLWQMYWATLKREHLIIFTFINCKDYNLLYIKLTRFVTLMAGDMALNAFFFSDKSMHKLFLNYGKYDFFQQIPQIVYSTIISQLIEVFLCFLSLTDKHIYQIKSALKTISKAKIEQIIKCVYIKLTIFYIFTFICFVVYWYIISVFCGVYRNTQKHFIKDSIISFSICLAYPFILYFLSASLRICSLRLSKNRLKCIYNLSSIIPFF